MIRTRYAPSPTGEAHLGALRTVLFDYLLAKSTGGQFLIRVEDTDQARFVPGASERILEAVQWLGLNPDEGVFLNEAGELAEKGEFGPYVQSKRLEIYGEYAEKLLESGHGYRCFCTKERLDEVRAEQEKNHLAPRYDRHCRYLTKEESNSRAVAGEAFVIRQAMPDNEIISLNDAIRGEISFNSRDLDDQILLKTDGFPTYHLASVVDDHLMQISHVLRGDEWLASAPKNLLLYRAFGFEPPIFAHLPVILGPDKGKLSKRHGAKSVLEYRDEGYLPEALVNFLVLLGWSSGTEEEIFTLDELVSVFKLERIHPSPAKFDSERLNWFNGVYIRALTVEALRDRLIAFHGQDSVWAERYEQSPIMFDEVVASVQERLKTLAEFAEFAEFYWTVAEYDPSLLVPKKADTETARLAIATAIKALNLIDEADWNHEMLESELREAASEVGMPAGNLLWPIRVALTGLPASPGSFEVLTILGKDESLNRSKIATKKLGKQ